MVITQIHRRQFRCGRLTPQDPTSKQTCVVLIGIQSMVVNIFPRVTSWSVLVGIDLESILIAKLLNYQGQ